MTDISRRLAWRQVQPHLRIAADDWPDALAPEDIGLLHEWDGQGTPDQARIAAFASLLEDEMKAGRLPFEEVKREEPPMIWDPLNPSSCQNWQISREVIRAADVAEFLKDEVQGRYLAIWLTPERVERTAPQGVVTSEHGPERRRLWHELKTAIPRVTRNAAARAPFLADDWPPALTGTSDYVVWWLAALEIIDGPAVTWKSIEAAHTAAARFLQGELDNGRIPATRETRTITKSVHVRDAVFQPVTRDGGRLLDQMDRRERHSELIASRQRQPQRRAIYEDRDLQEVHFTVRAADLVSFYGEHPPGRYMAAWLAPYQVERETETAQQQAFAATAAPKDTRMKRKAVIQELGRQFTKLEGELESSRKWTRAFQVPLEDSPDGKTGWYYLEPLKEACRNRWGGPSETKKPHGVPTIAEQATRGR